MGGNLKQNKTILLVEDNPDHVLLAKRALKLAKVDGVMIVMSDGEQALAYLKGKSGSALPHVVLLDLGLPGMGGLEVLKQIRSDVQTHELPVVILSTSDEISDKRQGYAIGANSYILKPVEFTRFVHVVERLAEYWLELNESYA
jgi:two-component system response regulator